MGKQLLRKALPSWVSDDIKWRKKRGFTAPMYTWLKEGLKREMQNALSTTSEMNALFDMKPFENRFDAHLSGADHTDMLFRWLMLSKQLEKRSQYV